MIGVVRVGDSADENVVRVARVLECGGLQFVARKGEEAEFCKRGRVSSNTVSVKQIGIASVVIGIQNISHVLDVVLAGCVPVGGITFGKVAVSAIRAVEGIEQGSQGCERFLLALQFVGGAFVSGGLESCFKSEVEQERKGNQYKGFEIISEEISNGNGKETKNNAFNDAVSYFSAGAVAGDAFVTYGVDDDIREREQEE